MTYDIKVGDYVETIYGGKGYVSRVNDEAGMICWIITETNNLENAVEVGKETYGYESSFERCYKRIGKYDFTAKQRVIDPIDVNNPYEWTEPIINKINEIIKWINEREN